MGTIHIIFGVPGSGKTTELVNVLKKRIALGQYGTSEILLASYTRTAARHLAAQLPEIEDENIGTLHAHAFRCLRKEIGDTGIAESAEGIKLWNEWVRCNGYPPRYRIGAPSDLNDPLQSSPEVGKRGDALLAQLHRLRATLVPHGEWPDEIRTFYQIWCDFKYQHDVLDFSDMLEWPLLGHLTPDETIRIGCFDEVQDSTPLQLALIRQWNQEHFEECWLAGDDDQCQPPGTQVLTTNGTVNIEALDPNKHTLVSYDRTHAQLRPVRDFAVDGQGYYGTLFHVSAGGHTTRCTEGHRWLVRWNEAAKRPGVHVVYLMRQGSKWRVGWCRLFKADGGFHLGVRARLEQADAAYILKVCTSKSEATAYESLVAARFGLPQVMFNEHCNSGLYTQEVLDGIYTDLAEDNLTYRAQTALAAHGVSAPVWTPYIAKQKRGGASQFVIAAGALVPHYMEVPLPTGYKQPARWEPVQVTRETYEGKVYGLSVKPTHLYVADGLITHNCIYTHAGADPRYLVEDIEGVRAERHILERSWRVPSHIARAAQAQLVGLRYREPKKILPAHEGGEVLRSPATWKTPELLLSDIEQALEAGQTIMLLTTCQYMLIHVLTMLRREGIPFHNPWRSVGEWNPLRSLSHQVPPSERLAAFLDGPTRWNAASIHMWYKEFAIGDQFAARVRPIIITEKDRGRNLHDLLADWFTPEGVQALTTPNVDWYLRQLCPEKRGEYEYAARIVRRFGPSMLRTQPMVTVGTIHSVKGGEADVVILFPSLSQQAADAWRTTAGRDAIIRMMYVGMTRARKKLILASGVQASLTYWFK